MDKSKWEVNNKTFGEVFDLFMGRTPSRDNDLYWQNGKYEWLSIGDMGDTKYLSKTKEKVSEEAIVNMQLVPENTVVMSFKLSIGKVGITSIPLYTNEAIMAFPPQKGYHILPTYLYYYLQAYKWQPANRAVMGKTLNKSVISGAKISIPPVEDQQRIVAELDCLNEMIALKQEQLKEFDKLAQSIFYDMFGDPVSNEKRWDVIKLGDICSCITKGTTPTTLGFPFVEEGINFVKVESFVDGKIDSSKLTHIGHECHQALSRSQLESEDLLICIAGATIGKMAFVDASILPANTNQACAIVRLKDKNNLRFIHYYLALKLKNDIMKMGKGVAQPNLSLGQLRDFTISLPPLSLQQQFAEKIQAIEAQKELVKKSIAETQHLLDSRMDYYFD